MTYILNTYEFLTDLTDLLIRQLRRSVNSLIYIIDIDNHYLHMYLIHLTLLKIQPKLATVLFKTSKKTQ